MHGPIRRAAALFGERGVWGSDWPHTSIDPAIDTPYDSLWRPVVEALGPAQAAKARRENAVGLYGAT
jgi:predicted TIM-barrel fold metal-dependent hydrolase